MTVHVRCSTQGAWGVPTLVGEVERRPFAQTWPCAAAGHSGEAASDARWGPFASALQHRGPYRSSAEHRVEPPPRACCTLVTR